MNNRSKRTQKPADNSPAVESAHQTTSATLSDRDYLLQALLVAKSAGADVPVGAVIVKNGKVISSGCNQREASGDPTAHAEIVALRAAAATTGSWRLDGTTLYTTLEPCPMCAEAIIQSRVARVVFGAYEPLSGAAGSAFNLFLPGRSYPIPEVIGGIMENECKALIVEFFRHKSKLS